MTKFLKNVKDFCATRSFSFLQPQSLCTGDPKNQHDINITYTPTKPCVLTKNFPTLRSTLKVRHKPKNGELQNAKSFDILQKFFLCYVEVSLVTSQSFLGSVVGSHA